MFFDPSFGIIGFAIAIIVLSVLAFIFWLLMLIDCVKSKKFRHADMVVWILIIVLLGIIGAIIYYFLEKY